jgi:hypothetical protein
MNGLNKKLLFITLWKLHPVKTGGHQRSLQVMESLMNLGYEVKILSALSRPNDYFRFLPKNPQKFELNLRHPLFASAHLPYYFLGTAPIPITAASFIFKPKEVKDGLDWADGVVLDFPYLLPWIKKVKKPIIYNAHNIEHMDYKYFSQVTRLTEFKAIEKADQVIVGSFADKLWIKEKFQNKPVLFLPGSLASSIEKSTANTNFSETKNKKALELIFLASSWKNNIEGLNFLQNFSLAEKSFLESENISFHVIGDIHPPGKEGPISYHGFQDQLEPWLKRSDGGLCPLFKGSGSNMKIATYLHHHLPILSTEKGLRGYEHIDQSAYVFTKSSFKKTLLQFLSASKENRDKKATAALNSHIKALASAQENLKEAMNQLTWN